MEPIEADESKMLAQAREKAAKLVADLLFRQADLEQSPSGLNPEQLAAGRSAMRKAVESARRMLKALEEAQQLL